MWIEIGLIISIVAFLFLNRSKMQKERMRFNEKYEHDLDGPH